MKRTRQPETRQFVQLYTDHYEVDIEGAQGDHDFNVTVYGAEAKDIVPQFYAGDILEALDYSDIMDYIAKCENERRNE